MSVLQNEHTFVHISQEIGDWQTREWEPMFLNDWLNAYSLEEIEVYADRFAIVDIDGDGITEIILEIAPTSQKLILRSNYYGWISANSFYNRAMLHLKVDGTFLSSGGASSGAVGRLCYSGAEAEPEILFAWGILEGETYYEFNLQGEEAEIALQEFFEKEDVEWFPFADISADMIF
jgi:hypothetical protein